MRRAKFMVQSQNLRSRYLHPKWTQMDCLLSVVSTMSLLSTAQTSEKKLQEERIYLRHPVQFAFRLLPSLTQQLDTRVPEFVVCEVQPCQGLIDFQGLEKVIPFLKSIRTRTHTVGETRTSMFWMVQRMTPESCSSSCEFIKCRVSHSKRINCKRQQNVKAGCKKLRNWLGLVEMVILFLNKLVLLGWAFHGNFWVFFPIVGMSALLPIVQMYILLGSFVVSLSWLSMKIRSSYLGSPSFILSHIIFDPTCL